MFLRFRFLLLAAGLFVAGTASAQRRSTLGLVLLPEAQVEVALKGDDYLLAGVSLVTNPSGQGGSTFAGGQLRLGYEHFWSKQWSVGATLRVLGGEYDGYGDFLGLGGNVTPGALLRHRGAIAGFTFGQRLGLEYAMTLANSSSANSESRDRALLRLRFDVDRLFPLGEQLALRPRVAYEAAAYLRLQRKEGETRERVIDFGALRAELGLRVSPLLDLTPWASSQTRYINSLPQTDANGNPTGGGRTNLVSPVVGLDVRLTLGAGKAGAERQQLPTQH